MIPLPRLAFVVVELVEVAPAVSSAMALTERYATRARMTSRHRWVINMLGGLGAGLEF